MKTSEVNPALNILLFEDKDFLNSLNPIEGYSKLLELKNRVVVYFIDGLCLNQELIFNAILKTGQQNWYYCFHGRNYKEPTIQFRNNYFESINILIVNFKRDFNEIKKSFANLSKNYLELEFNLDESENDMEVLNFNPIVPNYFTYIQIINKTWKTNYPINIGTEQHELRNSSLLKIVKEIDNRHVSISETKAIGRTFPILLVAFPFFNPVIKQNLKLSAKSQKEKLYIKLYELEQTTDYLNIFESTEDFAEDLGHMVLNEFVKPKLLFLDALTYLLSSFTFSPIIRFPLIGKSIYRELSIFNPVNDNFTSRKALKKIYKSILAFGEKLAINTISEDTKKYIQSRNGQILAISDLPIEWLILDKVPLSFSHDICRIPESNYQGIINNYSANNRINYSINKNTLKKTLIILSSEEKEIPDHEFTNSYDLIKISAKNLGYHYRYCKTIEEVSNAIKEIEPFLLIFDCHGNIDSATETSYLCIGDDKLTGNDIVQFNITAPIVFLSCCNTSPNYGYINKLHDAFFQAGAMTVTGTFLPISIKRGTTYYIRLLSLLKIELTNNLFNNWLSFISNIMRTSLIHDVIIKSYSKLKRDLSEHETKELSTVLLKIQIFENRKDVFLKLMNDGIKISEELTISIEDTDCEFLMYTHYGRPDLIEFKIF